MSRRRKLLPAWVALALTLVNIVYGFCLTFSWQNFAARDDEGMLMITIRRFLEGRALYDDIQTIYGPLYYFYEWLGHLLLRIPVSHESVRWISMTFWVLSALAVFALVYLATRSVLLAAVAHYLAFHTLAIIGTAPAHPQELGILLVAAFATAAFAIPGTTLLAFTLGALVGAMVVTKINLGIFGFIALSLTFLFAARRGLSRSILLPLSAGGAIVFPVLLMWGHQAEWWDRKFMILAVAAIASAVVVVAGPKLDWTIELRHFLAAALGMAVVTAVFAGFALAHGSTIHGIVELLILQPRRSFGQTWYLPAPIPDLAIPFALAGLVCAVAARRGFVTQTALAIGKLLFATTMAALSLDGAVDTMMFFAPPFFWLAALPASSGGVSKTRWSFARALLVFMGAIHILYAYPAAGDQVAFSTILMLAMGAICLVDALPALAERCQWPAAPDVTMLCAPVLIIGYIFSTGLALQTWRSGTPLGLPGTNRIRITRGEADTVRGVVTEIDASPCTILASAPGLLSFNFMTGKAAPRLIDFSAWMTSLSEERQRQTIAELGREPFPCVLYNTEMIDFWTNGAKFDSALFRYMMENFQTVRQVGAYQLMEPRTRGAL